MQNLFWIEFCIRDKLILNQKSTLEINYNSENYKKNINKKINTKLNYKIISYKITINK